MPTIVHKYKYLIKLYYIKYKTIKPKTIIQYMYQQKQKLISEIKMIFFFKEGNR